MSATVKAAGPYYRIFREIHFGDPAQGYDPAFTAKALKAAWARNMADASGKDIKSLQDIIDTPRARLRHAGNRVTALGKPFANAQATARTLQARLTQAAPTVPPPVRFALKGGKYGLGAAAFAAASAEKIPATAGRWLAGRGGQTGKGAVKKPSTDNLLAYLFVMQANNNPVEAAEYIPSFARNDFTLEAVKNAGPAFLSGPQKAFALAALAYAVKNAAAPALDTVFRGTDPHLLVNLTQGVLSRRLQLEQPPHRAPR
jgi:hypothetical protein